MGTSFFQGDTSGLELVRWKLGDSTHRLPQSPERIGVSPKVCVRSEA